MTEDTFRKEFKPLSDQQKDLMQRIKSKAAELETSVMWAVKGVTT